MNTEGPSTSFDTAIPKDSALLVEPEDDSECPQSDIDKMTLEILLNRSTYKRYLAKQNPEMLNTYQTKQRQQTKYNSEIRALVGELLTYVLSPDEPRIYPKQATSAMVDIMETLVDKCVAHLKTRDDLHDDLHDIDYAPAYDETEDTMFGTVDDIPKTGMSSFWGPKIKRQGSTGTAPRGAAYPAYTMDMYLSKKSSK